MSVIQHIDYRTKQQMRNKELESLRHKSFAKRNWSTATTDTEEEPPQSPRATQITAFLTNQTQSILEERRKQHKPWGKTSVRGDKATTTKIGSPPMWKLILDKVLSFMNNEIWQYEKRSLLADIQSIFLLVITTLFLWRFGSTLYHISNFAVRRLSFPAACAFLIYPMGPEPSESETSYVSSEISVSSDTK